MLKFTYFWVFWSKRPRLKKWRFFYSAFWQFLCKKKCSAYGWRRLVQVDPILTSWTSVGWMRFQDSVRLIENMRQWMKMRLRGDRGPLKMTGDRIGPWRPLLMSRSRLLNCLWIGLWNDRYDQWLCFLSNIYFELANGNFVKGSMVKLYRRFIAEHRPPR